MKLQNNDLKLTENKEVIKEAKECRVRKRLNEHRLVKINITTVLPDGLGLRERL